MKKVLPVLIIAVLFFQCQKDISFKGSGDTGISVIPSPINAGLQGYVIDQKEDPVAGAIIEVGTQTVTTDANGFFHITKVTLDKNTTLVTVQKDGYFKGYRIFAATSGCNQVFFRLVSRDLAGTVSGSSGGDATLFNGAKVSLPANSVVTASSGAAYTGDVKVYAAYIDPHYYDISKTIPGSFAANDKNGKRVILSSFGMLAVELESSGGEKLQVKDGSVATLTIPISTPALPYAPAAISLWYVDDETGIWKEEGTATKKGNNYVGTVKHFSFWNCDYSNNAVNLSVTLHAPDSLPLVNATVRITVTDSSRSAFGFTDSLGQVKGLVPANEDLKLEVLDECGDAIYTKDVEPLTQDIDLGVITINNTNDHVLAFTGTLLDCNNAPVSKGYALINFEGIMRYVATDATGKFTTSYIICGSANTPFTATVLAVDETAQQQGIEVAVPVTFPSTNAGNITACGTSSAQYINYTLDNDSSYSIVTNNVNDSAINGGGTDSSGINMGGVQYSGGKYSEITFTTANATSAGTYSLNNLGVQFSYNVTLEQPFNITFTSFPSVIGDFYEGAFEGKFLNGGIEHAITASFRVRRNY